MSLKISSTLQLMTFLIALTTAAPQARADTPPVPGADTDITEIPDSFISSAPVETLAAVILIQLGVPIGVGQGTTAGAGGTIIVATLAENITYTVDGDARHKAHDGATDAAVFLESGGHVKSATLQSIFDGTSERLAKRGKSASEVQIAVSLIQLDQLLN